MCLNFFKVNKLHIMDDVEETLMDSHQILCRLIESNGTSKREKSVTQYLTTVKYPPVKDFLQGLEWFNVSEPLSFTSHLKGKLVVLDFFTYCCINCMHILPDLKEIENEFSVEDGLVVVGVHSAKFDNEKDSANILSAVQRYNISHPVVNDSSMHMWKNCDVHCWPTLLLLGPNANPLVMLMGEGHRDDLTLYIKCALDYYKSKNEISHHKLPTKSAYHLLPELKGPLLFPGKITNYLTKSNLELLAISDTGNNRILVLKSDGTVIKQIGGKKAGFTDGTLENAEFNAPQGLVFKSETILYVADTENHAIRKIDLELDSVETVVGIGTQGNDRTGGRAGVNQAISSPWDLCLYRTGDMDMSFHATENDVVTKEILLIAMAGTHQIWALFLEDTVWWKYKKYAAGTCACIAGSGREENRNNAYPHSAAFAQPSGLALCAKNKEVYVADSESSSVRRISLVDGKVTAVVGGDVSPTNLFGFGDKDGKLYQAKLQHPLGLAMSSDDTTLFVTDTYNHKIKRVDISTNSIQSVCGTKAGNSANLSNLQFNEPADICCSLKDSKLFVADTNNHCIKTIKIDTKNAPLKVNTLELNFDVNDGFKKLDKTNLNVITSDKKLQVNLMGGKIILQVVVNLKNNLSVASGSPQKWSIEVPNMSWSSVPNFGANINCVDTVVSVPSRKDESNEMLSVVFNFVTCISDTCIPKKFVLDIPVIFTSESASLIEHVINVNVDPNEVTLA